MNAYPSERLQLLRTPAFVIGDWTDEDGRVALNLAVNCGASTNVLHQIRIACPDSVSHALAYALENGKPAMANKLLTAGCDIKFWLQEFQCENKTSLIGTARAISPGKESVTNSSDKGGSNRYMQLFVCV